MMKTTETTLKRNPLFTRPASANSRPGLQLTDRDLQILHLCYRHRFLDSDQIAALVGAQTKGRHQIRVRLQKLWLERYLERPEDQRILRIREGYRPLIYSLGHKGIAAIAEGLGLDIAKVRWTQKHDQIRAPYIKHALFISEFFTTLAIALKQHPGWQLTDWRQGRSIFEQVTLDHKTVSLRPDAFFTLTEPPQQGPPQAHHFLLEADLGTIREKSMLDRYRRYWAYWKRIRDEERVGRGQLPQGRQPRQPRALPIPKAFRVLTISANPTRANNLTTLARQADDDKRGSTMFYFTHRQWAIDNSAPLLKPIWHTPADSQPRSLL